MLSLHKYIHLDLTFSFPLSPSRSSISFFLVANERSGRAVGRWRSLYKMHYYYYEIFFLLVIRPISLHRLKDLKELKFVLLNIFWLDFVSFLFLLFLLFPALIGAFPSIVIYLHFFCIFYFASRRLRSRCYPLPLPLFFNNIQLHPFIFDILDFVT